jgi:hypothetical protein
MSSCSIHSSLSRASRWSMVSSAACLASRSSARDTAHQSQTADHAQNSLGCKAARQCLPSEAFSSSTVSSSLQEAYPLSLSLLAVGIKPAGAPKCFF